MPLRVLHQTSLPTSANDDLIKHAAAVREQPGCLAAEIFRDIESPESVAFIQLWEDQFQYSEYWERALETDRDNALTWAQPEEQPGSHNGSEFYSQQLFLPNQNRVWTPVDSRDRLVRISWPARGAIRIIIQSSVVSVDRPGAIANAQETRREPGCLQFGWHENIELAGEVLLLELWADQQIYDAHWHLRSRVGGGRGAGERTDRRRGPGGMEFYRYQPFGHLYDRWLPEDVQDWSDTVAWPD